MNFGNRGNRPNFEGACPQYAENDHLVSVILPVYNGAGFVRETIDSVLQQTYQNFELIVVNDGSGDATSQILSCFTDPRIVLLDLPRNHGVSFARNRGIVAARGEFVAFCDADDLCEPERLQVQLDLLMTDPGIDVCASSFLIFGNGPEQLVKNPRSDQEIKRYFFSGNCICQPSVFGRTEVFRKFPYNPEFRVSQDYELWTRMALGGVVFANLTQALVKYRLHPAQATMNKGDLVSTVSDSICRNYTLAYLGNPILAEFATTAALSLGDFRKFLDELAVVCGSKALDINIFRKLIAFQYKKLQPPGVRSFVAFMRFSHRHHLAFPWKYLLNLLLLCFIPVKKDSSLFDTLTKLKLYVPESG